MTKVLKMTLGSACQGVACLWSTKGADDDVSLWTKDQAESFDDAKGLHESYASQRVTQDKAIRVLTRQISKDYSTIKAMKSTKKQARTQRET